MADLFSLERIAAQNGWAMAGLGITIDLMCLSLLALIISQMPSLVSAIEKIQAIFKKDGAGSEQKQDADKRLKPEDLSPAGLPEIAGRYQQDTHSLGEIFLLADLYKLLEKKKQPPPHLTIKSLRTAGLLLPEGEGRFAWNV